MKYRTVLFALLVLALVPYAAQAHWDEGDPSKWVQRPDLAPTGIDVNAANTLADDFLCTETGLIRKIHIWGSWENDYLPFGDVPTGVLFTIGIYSDIPASQSGTGYSTPGQLLWYTTVYPDFFAARVWADNLQEGWLNPPSEYDPMGDTVCWQYNLWFREGSAFMQQGSPEQPIVYWLAIQASPNDQMAHFGWKTSFEHWNDSATWPSFVGPWMELTYPQGHPLVGQPVDFAFVIGDDTVEDWGDAPDPTYPTLAGSNGANHTVVPGLLMGSLIDADANGFTDPGAVGDDNDCAADEDGAYLGPMTQGSPAYVTISMAGATLGGYVDAWVDFGRDGSWEGPDDQILKSQWVPPGLSTKFYFGVPAWASAGTTYARFRLSSAGGLSYDGHAPDGEVEDYEVFVGHAEGWKWRQEPDLGCHGIDINACYPFVLADDFPCTEPGRLDEISIWGSWLGDFWPPDGLGAKFTLSIHADIPADESPTGYSMPGEVLWTRDFPGYTYEAGIWASEIVEGWMDPPDAWQYPADWTCWRYTFHIPPEDAFHQVGTIDHPVVYWLDVQANVAEFPDARFGWKTSSLHWNDAAVWGNGYEPYMGDWWELVYPPDHGYIGRDIDLAFEITSTYGTDVPEDEVTEPRSTLRSVPNPFNPRTTLEYVVPTGGGRVTIEVFGVNGRLIRTLVDEEQAAGRQTVEWDGRDGDGNALPTGVYLAKLVAPGLSEEAKMILLK